MPPDEGESQTYRPFTLSLSVYGGNVVMIEVIVVELGQSFTLPTISPRLQGMPRKSALTTTTLATTTCMRSFLELLARK